MSDHDPQTERAAGPIEPLGERGTRNRLAQMGCVLLVLAGLLGGTAVGHPTPDLGQVVLIVAVALFVAAMLTLALGMTADARRRR